MRRFISLIAVPLLASVVLAGCGASNALPTATPSANTDAKVTATGGFGTTPTVNIPKVNPSGSLTVKTLVQGSGPVLIKSDALVVNFVLYFWSGKTAQLKANTFTTNPTVISGTLIPGLQNALIGQKVGSRVLAVIPPAQGYGTNGNQQLGVSGATTLVFVIDVLKAYSPSATATGTAESTGGSGLPTITSKPGQAPVATIPGSNPPGALEVKTLIKGTGPAITKGEYVIAQYVGYIWRTKKVFGSSWTSGSPFGFVFQAAPPQVIPGWDTGLVGQLVGSRVMLVIPPKEGYGSSGASQAGIKGTDTLVYVVDILDAFQKSAA
jgi:FKBP-type peptidyl-prolyl cis-trans isomerase